jgi:CBS domain-containing protein
MSSIVRDIMNPKLLYVRDGDPMTPVRAQIIRYGVTGVPVLDDDHRPVGFVSLRDLSTDEDQVRVSCPAVTVQDTETVANAARKLAESTHHHLVVVDDRGVAVGMVSAVDLLRELVGVPPRHPPRFATPVTWSEEP